MQNIQRVFCHAHLVLIRRPHIISDPETGAELYSENRNLSDSGTKKFGFIFCRFVVQYIYV